MKAKLIKEDLNENLSQGLFGVMSIDPDYTSVTFYADEASAQEDFDNSEGGVLFSLDGPGSVYAGRDSEGTGGVSIIDDKYPDW